MKKLYESPTLELCEFVVAARLSGSGIGIGHSKGQPSGCTFTASSAPDACAPPSSPNSSGGNNACIN